MPANRREKPETESAALIDELAAEALMKRRAALAAAGWASRAGATADELAEMLEALGIEKDDLGRKLSPSIITLR
jgi:hypothetical protein